MFEKIKYFVFCVLCVASLPSNAVLVTQEFEGVVVSISESINGVQLPIEEWLYAPLFSGALTIDGAITYDTAQPDSDPSPNTGTYSVGILEVNIPQLNLQAIVNSSSMQISAFNDTSNPDDQFFAFEDGVDVFTNDAGIPTPFSFSLLVFGNLDMLANDQLPLDQIAWDFGNSSFSFLDGDGNLRQVVLLFEPTLVPLPGALPLMFAAMVVVSGFVRRRRV